MLAAVDASLLVRVLLAVIEPRAKPEVFRWLLQSLPSTPFQRGSFFGNYAGVGRRLGGQQAALAPSERDELARAGIEVPDAFSLTDLARAALLHAAFCALDPSEHVALITEIFRKGDSGERIALLRTLPLLPAPERFATLAVEACRTHVLDVFAAIACENPFPARYFPEPSFNQLVMKTLFLDLPLERVLGWRGRCNAALRTSVTDFEAERRAAGRPVPAGVASIRATEGASP